MQSNLFRNFVFVLSLMNRICSQLQCQCRQYPWWLRESPTSFWSRINIYRTASAGIFTHFLLKAIVYTLKSSIQRIPYADVLSTTDHCVSRLRLMLKCLPRAHTHTHYLQNIRCVYKCCNEFRWYFEIYRCKNKKYTKALWMAIDRIQKHHTFHNRPTSIESKNAFSCVWSWHLRVWLCNEGLNLDDLQRHLIDDVYWNCANSGGQDIFRVKILQWHRTFDISGSKLTRGVWR